MKRRNFLKLLGIAPFAPSVLKAKEPHLTEEKPVEIYETFTATEDGWSYLCITADMGVSNDDCTIALYGCSPDGNYKKIDNYCFVNNDDGTYNINITGRYIL